MTLFLPFAFAESAVLLANPPPSPLVHSGVFTARSMHHARQKNKIIYNLQLSNIARASIIDQRTMKGDLYRHARRRLVPSDRELVLRRN